MRPHGIVDLLKILRAQKLGPGRLEALQSAKLRRLIRHSYDHVPYVRRMLDERGIRPGDIRGVADLGRLPLMDKSAYQGLTLEERKADDIPAGQCRTFQTSGTTGRPIRFLMSRGDFTLRNLNSARAYLASGYRPWQRMAVLAGDRLVNERRSWNERLGLWRRREISSWKSREQWLEELAAWRPHVLIGRVTTLLLLAEAARRAGGAPFKPRRVFASAEMLYPDARKTLAETFGCPVLDFYLSFEGGCLAWECPACGAYHMSADMVIIEVLREDGHPAKPGQEGEVVITNLHSSAMPLIRYRQGDSVLLSAKQPACRRRLPLLDRIDGRREDMLTLPSGRRITPQAIPHVFIPVPGIRSWQVVQTAIDRLEIRIEPRPEFDAAARHRLQEELMRLLREDVRIEIIEMDAIPRDPAAKARPIVSLVTSSERSW